jgi:Cu(I)/Ag(I) efflux system membrane protein CusA/SilA
VLSGGTVGQVGLRPVRITTAPKWIVAAPPADELVRTATVRAGHDGRGQPVPLGLLGRVGVEVVPATLHAERGELSGYVYVDLKEGTDLASYVARARADVGHVLEYGTTRLLPGERLDWTGQYEALLAGERRLWLIVPIVALTMVVLLYWQFRNITEALIVLVSVPFALVGSFWTLYLLDYKLSAPVWVGLLSVVGLAMQTGVVMVVYIDEAFRQRLREGKMRSRADIIEAHAEGTVRRLRPKLMTVVTMAAGLFPLLWSQGAGAEIMKRVAAPMVGGLATSAFLTLEVIPVLYTIWRTRQLAAAERRGVPLEELAEKGPRVAVREVA